MICTLDVAMMNETWGPWDAHGCFRKKKNTNIPPTRGVLKLALFPSV